MNVLLSFTHTCTCTYMYLHVHLYKHIVLMYMYIHVPTQYTHICTHASVLTFTYVYTPCSIVLLEVRTGTVLWFTTTRGWPITKPAERPSLYKHYRTYSPRYRQRWPRPLYSRNGQSKHSRRQWTFGPLENRYMYDSSHNTHSYNGLRLRSTVHE